MVSRDALLATLPPFNNRSVLIESVQDVPDIMKEVVSAHYHFADDYNFIWKFFYTDSLYTTCKLLFDFCKKNIRYVVESENKQTTKSPSAILAMGDGDCKHYAAFIAGVLNAITRNTGERIDWRYRFASYDFFDSQPGHVFVMVYDDGNEYWIDPVLNYFNERVSPVYITDKKIKSMPLYRVSGIPYPQYNASFAFPESSVGFIDPEIAVQATAGVVDLFTSFINIVKGDKVPNYPVKSKATFDSLVASIAKVLPLPPKSLEDANRLLAIAYKERELSVARGTDRATLTAIQLWDEAIEALKYYVSSNGGNPDATQTELTAGVTSGSGKLSPLWLIGGAGLGLYLYSKRKSRTKKVTGMKKALPVLVGLAVLYFMSNKPAPAAIADIGN